MTWWQWLLLLGADALIVFLIVHFFLRISNDYRDIKHRYQYPSCKSCDDTNCSCGLGLDNEPDREPGRSGEVQGENDLPEAGRRINDTR